MATIDKLSQEDRDLFSLVSSAAFANPFSRARDELDREIAGVFGSDSVDHDDILDRALARVDERIGKLRSAGKANITRYGEGDAELLRTALLFEVFHRHLADFDALIDEQQSAGEEPCPVPFAREAIRHLVRSGFEPEKARDYFAFFYQLRRAFYFICGGLAGESASMYELRRHLWNNVFTYDTRLFARHLWNRLEDFSTLILGETGTGKGASAAAIGRSGFIPFDEKRGVFVESFTSNFISINLSQFPEGLIESELFGHTKGSFTGAVNEHRGVFSLCKPHGSIFLDEIGEVGAPVQIKLLQVLQERTFSPVGSHERERFSGRVIAATNRSPQELRHEGLMRDDFYYRLCTDLVVVPPLRQRISESPSELDLMVKLLVKRIVGEASDELAARICDVLRVAPGEDYPWPGNVRELEQAVRRVLLTGRYSGDEVLAEPGASSLAEEVAAGTVSARELNERYCAQLYDSLGTYEAVAKRTGLDRRTVKKNVDAAKQQTSG